MEQIVEVIFLVLVAVQGLGADCGHPNATDHEGHRRADDDGSGDLRRLCCRRRGECGRQLAVAASSLFDSG